MIRDEDWVLKLLAELSDKQFYGKLTLEFQGGNLVLTRTEEVRKPPAALAALERGQKNR